MAAQHLRHLLRRSTDRDPHRKPASATAARRAPAADPSGYLTLPVDFIAVDARCGDASATLDALSTVVNDEADLDDLLDDGDVIAGVIPIPSGIASGVRDALAAAILESFPRAEELDAWLHARHRRLDGATPFERLVACDGSAVLQALTDDRERDARVPPAS